MLHISSFSVGHETELGELIVGIQRDEFGIAIDLKDQPDLQNIPSFYQHGAGNFWVATLNEKLVGTIALLDIGNGQAALRKMFVAADYRGREFGVGAALLQTLMNWAKAQGLRQILLGTTDRFLAAHRFYEKNGFIEIEKSQLPAAFPVMAIDSKFYLCQLS